MQQHLIRLVFAFLLLLAAGPAFAQVGGAGPGPRPQGGGSLPQDLDTLTVNIVASTTHTQAAATLCTTTICEVDTGSSGDGIALRQCTQAPMRQLVVNHTGNPIQVYGSGTDTINGNATGTGISLPTTVTNTLSTGSVEFLCTKGGPAATWYSQ